MTVLYAEQLLSADGWLESSRLYVVDGRIAHIERGSAQPGDERHALIVPAVANLHSHAFQRGIAGFTERRGPDSDDFWTWRETMYRFALRMTPDQLEAVAAQAYVEMLESGFGRVGEFHYLHHDVHGKPFSDVGEMAARITAAAQAAGIALTLLPVFYAHSGFGGAPPKEAQRRFVTDVDSYSRLMDRCVQLSKSLPNAIVGVAPHSLRAVAPDELMEVLRLCAGPIHIHIAEQVNEVRDCLSWCGATPVQWLLDNAPVNARWCLVHATHIGHAELVGIAESGAIVGLCPITEANLGDGIFPGAEFVAAGGRFGVGTDSNVCISLTGELALLEYAQRLALKARNVIADPSRSTGMTLLQHATYGGASALGVRNAGIAIGNSADLVSLDVNAPSMLFREGDALIDSWFFASREPMVDCVWVNGSKWVEHGRHRDRDRIRASYAKALKALSS